jgi:catalase
MMQMEIIKGQTAYFPNTLSGGCPHLAKMAEGAFTSYEERIDAKKIRTRSESFNDHFSQPALFYRSLSKWEQQHLADAYTFELGKCKHTHIKERMLWVISQIDTDLAKKVAAGLGLEIPNSIEQPINQSIGADADVEKHQPPKKKNYLDAAPSLSQAHTKFESIATRQIAVLVADGFSIKNFNKMKDALEKEGAMVKLIAPHGGEVVSDEGIAHEVHAAIMTTESVLYDAIYIPGGTKAIEKLKEESKFIKFINEAFKHCKAIAVDEEGENLIDSSIVSNFKQDVAVLINKESIDFINAIAKHRNWDRMEVTKNIAV